MTPPLACTVRDCGLFLERHDGVLRCARRHSYDVAKTGYINLLQPQDRKSLQAGDTPDAVMARSRLVQAGVGARLISTLTDRVARLVAERAVIADLGSGSGELLGGIAAAVPVVAIGIDLSTAAVEHAARRYPAATWVVANADRRLPLLDRSVDLMLSVHGRRHPAEAARVLAAGGHLVIAVPAPDDLAELRAHVQGRVVTRARAAAAIEEHTPLFTLLERFEVREQHSLEGGVLRDLLRGTYRGERRSAREQIAALARLDVTLASDVLVFARP